MKKLFIICLCFPGLFFSPGIHSKEPCSLHNTSFNAGEKIRYQVYYNLGFLWIPAGICHFETSSTIWLEHESYPALHLKAVGVTHRAYDSFFMVRDTLESFVDPQSLIPFEAFKYTHEGKWNGQDIFLFSKSDSSSGWNIRTQLKRRGVWKDPSYTHSKYCGFDIMSSIYRMRTIPDSILFSGKTIHIPVRLDDGEYDIWLIYKGKSLIRLHKGDTHYAHYFELSLIEGSVFKKGDVLKLWLGDNGNRLPLQIESPIRVGSVKAVFDSAENLRYAQDKQN